MSSRHGRSGISRRQALGMIAVTAGGSFVSPQAFAQSRPAQAARLITGAGVCTLMPQTTAGPFYLDRRLARGAIAEGRGGVPLVLALQIVDADCVPLPGSRVDIWHCDAEGAYSGYPRQPGGHDMTGETFLRGTLNTDGQGVATFTSIYPGWYPGRTPHVHFRAFPAEGEVVTGQMFFPDDLSREIYRSIRPYNRRGLDGATFNDRDGIARRAGAPALAEMARQGGTLRAALVISVAARS